MNFSEEGFVRRARHDNKPRAAARSDINVQTGNNLGQIARVSTREPA